MKTPQDKKTPCNRVYVEGFYWGKETGKSGGRRGDLPLRIGVAEGKRRRRGEERGEERDRLTETQREREKTGRWAGPFNREHSEFSHGVLLVATAEE